MQFIKAFDYILLPFYLSVIFLIAYSFRNKKYPVGHPWRPYFIPGLMVKIIGAVFIGMVYQYYYGGGDTFSYFKEALVINSAGKESIIKEASIILHIPKWYEGNYYNYTSLLFWYDLPSNYIVCATTAALNIFTFNSYLVTSVLFGCIAYTGFWALFRTFATQYPKIIRQIAIATLFIPTTIVWGSGVFKDTICMFGLGWMTYSVFQMLIKRNFTVVNIVFFLLCFLLLKITKIYILLAFLPSAAIWIFFIYNTKIRNRLVRYFTNILTIATVILLGVYFSSNLKDEMGTYALDNLTQTASTTRVNIIHDSGEDGSAYDIGEFEPTIGGMLLKAPSAINVTLFRPYIWESKNVLMLFNAVESLIFLICTLRMFILVGVGSVIRIIRADPNLQFFIVFTLIFAFFVGLSTGNFGSLSRYKIPCMPFFLLTLVIIFYTKFDKKEKKLFFGF